MRDFFFVIQHQLGNWLELPVWLEQTKGNYVTSADDNFKYQENLELTRFSNQARQA